MSRGSVMTLARLSENTTSPIGIYTDCLPSYVTSITFYVISVFPLDFVPVFQENLMVVTADSIYF